MQAGSVAKVSKIFFKTFFLSFKNISLLTFSSVGGCFTKYFTLHKNFFLLVIY